MEEKKELKQLLINHLQNIVATKIENVIKSIESAKEARDNETKSTVGDKYETARAMMQFEIDKSNQQLLKARQLETELSKIDVSIIHKKAELGSVVITDIGSYFISIGHGKIKLGKDLFFAVSPQSPVGKLLVGKKPGDKIDFRGQEILVHEVF